MSSFICSAKHFNSVEKKLHGLLQNDDNFYWPYELREVLPSVYGFCYPKNTLIEQAEADISKMVDKLREINVLCVSLQYKDHYTGRLNREIDQQLTIVKERTETKDLSLHGLYNALKCIRYQIEIEHLEELRQLSPEESKALRFLNLMISAIAETIVSNLPEDYTNRWEVD